MSTAVKTVLVLCTGNSARSIMAEALINHLGEGRWQAVSAGSHPTGVVNPFALQALAEAGIPSPPDARSKSWQEFAEVASAPIDLVITVCNNAANETCPRFPGPARVVHLPFDDPASAQGTELEKLDAFRMVLRKMAEQLPRLLASSCAS